LLYTIDRLFEPYHTHYPRSYIPTFDPLYGVRVDITPQTPWPNPIVTLRERIAARRVTLDVENVRLADYAAH
jgi:hypothetical protein